MICRGKEELRLTELIMQGTSLDLPGKTKQELLQLVRELSELARGLLRNFDTKVKDSAQTNIDRLERELASKDRELKRITESRIQLEKELDAARQHSRNWGGARTGAGRKETGVKRSSRKMIHCTSRMAAAFKEYGRQMGKNPLERILKQQNQEEQWDFKTRYLYLSKEEWEAVKPVYEEYLKKFN